jgi:diguanylate cyclase (GGDEF)-like protein
MKKQAVMDTRLEEIRNLLSHLQSEVTSFEDTYSELLGVLRQFEGTCNIDDLTGLLRRRPFFKMWETLLEECRRLNDDCGVLLIDVDHFKRVNDTHGHQTGDEVLKRISSLLKQFESPNCIVSRYGGEEFAVAIRGKDAEILGTAELIRRGAERLHGPVIGPDGAPSSQVEWKCTLSVGMASAHKQGFDAPRLLKAADGALYEAKSKGRNQVRAA